MHEYYRKKNDTRAIRKNVTIPSWLNVEAKKAGINFSATLQGSLKDQLGL
jgi:post-segregation antitoxin (ccd killing protein)